MGEEALGAITGTNAVTYAIPNRICLLRASNAETGHPCDILEADLITRGITNRRVDEYDSKILQAVISHLEGTQTSHVPLTGPEAVSVGETTDVINHLV